MVFKIKNMVSSRCVSFVQKEMNNLGIYNITVELGEVEVRGILPVDKLLLLDVALRNGGLELMEDKELLLIEQIKAAAYELIFNSDDIIKSSHSDFISQKLNNNYTYLSNIFSKTEGITIEKYIINLRIERVKELLIYTDLSLEVMAYNLHYSSPAHLSNQFKKNTGMTPSCFKQQKTPSAKQTTFECFKEEFKEQRTKTLKPVAK
jgi:AraC-like DNA-binding protein